MDMVEATELLKTLQQDAQALLGFYLFSHGCEPVE